MAIVIPAAVEGLRIANRAGVVAQRKGVATQLADSLLNEIVATKNWYDAAQSGTFGPEWSGYKWRVLNETWGRETMRILSVEVTYEVQSKEYRVVLSTLVPPT